MSKSGIKQLRLLKKCFGKIDTAYQHTAYQLIDFPLLD